MGVDELKKTALVLSNINLSDISPGCPHQLFNHYDGEK